MELEEFRKDIKKVKNLDELFSTIDEIGSLKGAKQKGKKQKTYTSEELKGRIKVVMTSEAPFRYITRTGGLRYRVKELFEEGSTEIRGAQTFDQLYSAIDKIGSIPGTRHVYSPNELKETIGQVRSGRLPFDYVTKTEGLRNKVTELYFKEKEERKGYTIREKVATLVLVLAGIFIIAVSGKTLAITGSIIGEQYIKSFSFLVLGIFFLLIPIILFLVSKKRK